MNLQTGSFDIADAIRHLDRRLAALERAAPSATMDAAMQGQTLAEMGLEARLWTLLERHGFAVPADIAAASDEALLAIDGIGPKSLQQIRETVG